MPRLTLGVAREKSYGCFVHRQQPVKKFRLSSGTPCLVSMCVCVCVCKGGRERERRALYKRQKSFGVGLVLSGCFVHRQQPVKMFRLSSGTPCLVSMCVCVCKGERALYKREKSFGVGFVLSGCFVHRQQPVKMFRLSSGTPC